MLPDEDLRRSAVVVLNDVSVSAGLARRLASYVEQGGGLFVAAGPRDMAAGRLLPAAIGNPVDRTRGDAGASARSIRTSDTRAVSRAAQRRLRVRAGLRLSHLTPAKNAQVLARFDAGAPAVAERRSGNGRVLIWGRRST